MTTPLRALIKAACSDYVPWTTMSKPESDFIAYCFNHAEAIADLIDATAVAVGSSRFTATHRHALATALAHFTEPQS